MGTQKSEDTAVTNSGSRGIAVSWASVTDKYGGIRLFILGLGKAWWSGHRNRVDVQSSDAWQRSDEGEAEESRVHSSNEEVRRGRERNAGHLLGVGVSFQQSGTDKEAGEHLNRTDHM